MKACCFAYSGGEPDEVLFHVCDEHAELSEREALEFDHEGDPNWKEKEEWSDIPVLQPITLQARKLNPEAWK